MTNVEMIIEHCEKEVKLAEKILSQKDLDINIRNHYLYLKRENQRNLEEAKKVLK